MQLRRDFLLEATASNGVCASVMEVTTLKKDNHNSHDEGWALVLMSKMIDDAYSTALQIEQTFAHIYAYRSVHDILHEGYEARKKRVSKTAAYDKRELAKRLDKEGMSFLTITLPKLGKWLDSMLMSGELEPVPKGFQASMDLSGVQVPLFLNYAWSVFVREYGFALSSLSATQPLYVLIRQLRTICYSFYKLEVPFTDEQLQKASRAFEVNDGGCYIPWWHSKETPRLVDTAEEVCWGIFKGFDPF